MSLLTDLFETTYLKDRVILAFRQAPIAASVSTIGCLCVVAAFWTHPMHQIIWIWAAIVLVNNVFRLAAGYFLMRQPVDSIPVDQVQTRIILTSVVGGLAWGAAPAMVFEGIMTAEFQFMLFALCAMCAGSAGVFSMIPTAWMTWYVCAVLPTVFIVLINAPQNTTAMSAAVMLCLYVAVLCVTGIGQYRTLLTLFRLRDRTETLDSAQKNLSAESAEWAEELAAISRRLSAESRARSTAEQSLEDAKLNILLSTQALSLSHSLTEQLSQAIDKVSHLEYRGEPGSKWTAEEKKTLSDLRALLEQISEQAKNLFDTEVRSASSSADMQPHAAVDREGSGPEGTGGSTAS